MTNSKGTFCVIKLKILGGELSLIFSKAVIGGLLLLCHSTLKVVLFYLIIHTRDGHKG